MHGKWTKALLVGMGSLIALTGFWMYCHLEIYCVFYPAIDTTFTDTYTEAAFDRVRPGMAEAEVQKLLGKPLDVARNPDGSETWWYSHDGRCWFGDFAWLGRSIQFKNSTVERTEKHVYED